MGIVQRTIFFTKTDDFPMNSAHGTHLISISLTYLKQCEYKVFESSTAGRIRESAVRGSCRLIKDFGALTDQVSASTSQQLNYYARKVEE